MAGRRVDGAESLSTRLTGLAGDDAFAVKGHVITDYPT
jgi:hypothetical protein